MDLVEEKEMKAKTQNKERRRGHLLYSGLLRERESEREIGI